MRCLVFLAATALLLAQSPEPRITRLYIFGDSYSDNGAGYIDGNGPTAVAYLAQRLGFELKPSTTAAASPTDSLNFAVSGAQTGRGDGRKVKDALLGRGMADQVDDFVARVQARQIGFDPKTTLFFIAGGLNDRRLPGPETVANLEAEIRKLYDSGARLFRVAVLPEAIPSFSEVGVRLNSELRRIPAEIHAQVPDVQISLSHWGEFFDEVMRNPRRYGIENTTDKCAGRAIFDEDATPCAKPAAYYYYHAGHPSTAVHKLVGDKLYEELTASK
jgi:phospholipase/lecithinase/hemolysin